LLRVSKKLIYFIGYMLIVFLSKIMAFRKFVGTLVLGSGVAGGLRYTHLVKLRDVNLVDNPEGNLLFDQVVNTDYGLFSCLNYRQNKVLQPCEVEPMDVKKFSYSRLNVSHQDKDGLVTKFPSKCPFSFGSK
jgi:hypothetical protein